MQEAMQEFYLWHKMPNELRIKLEPGEVRISPMGHDAVIVKTVNGKTLKALVPTHTLGANKDSVPTQLAGKSNGNVILYLPTSNEGRPKWVIPESELASILIKD